MATTHPIQAGAQFMPGSNSHLKAESPDAGRGSGDSGSFVGASPNTLVTTGGNLAGIDTVAEAGASQHEELRLLPSMARMPVPLNVGVPVRGFRVRNLLAMTSGEVIATRWANGEDLPLSAGEVQLAWSEFEVVETRLAVRITRLA